MTAQTRIGIQLSPQEALRGNDASAPRWHIRPEYFSHPDSHTYQTICRALGQCVGMETVSVVAARLEADDADLTRAVITVAGVRSDGKIDATHVPVPWGAWDNEKRDNPSSRDWAHTVETIGRTAAMFCREIPRTEFDGQRRYEDHLVHTLEQYGVEPFVEALYERSGTASRPNTMVAAQAASA